MTCWPHVYGIDISKPLTFDPNCGKCQELLAAGKRTGREPPPRDWRKTRRAERTADDQFAAMRVIQGGQAKARRKKLASVPAGKVE